MLSSIQTIITYDLETGGLKYSENPILEIACCPFNNELVDLQEYESGIMKGYDNLEITDGALNANGITREQISKGRNSQEVADEFIKYVSKLKVGRNKPILAGHNILKFDTPYLTDFLKRHGYDIDKYINLDYQIDTMWECRLRWPELTNYKLGTCCEELGVELTDAHRAINDTRANKNLLKELIRSLRSDVKKSAGTYKRPVFQF